MTQTLDHIVLTGPDAPTEAVPSSVGREPRRPSRWHHVAAFVRARRTSLLWFLPLFVVAAIVQFVNLAGSPQRIDDEGTYVAQAYAVDKLGALTHYTYWYDHPPLGWIQIGIWTSLTDGFARYDTAVLAGREFMVVAALASTALLWMLARRLEMSRPAAAVAVAIFALSPLAVQFHRTVFLDNVATPWLLAAFVLVFAPRRQLLAFTAAAICVAVAVLTKETYALFLPFLGWQMWRSAHRDLRRYTVSLSAAIVVLLGLAYVLLSVIKGELFPGMNRVSLLSGIGFQLSGRAASGSLFDPSSAARVTAGQWLQLDPVLLVVAPLAALLVLRSRRFWPVAGTLIFLLLFMMRPGYLPVPYVIGMLPFAALVVPAAAEVWIRRIRAGSTAAGSSTRRRRVQLLLVAAVTAVAVVAAVPMWGVQLRGLLRADLDLPARQAEAWVDANVDRGYRLVVDDSMWVDFVRDGFPRNNVTWYYKVDTDPAVQALAPGGWRDYDYVVSTNSMRTYPDGSPTVKQALDNAQEVASFGAGDKAVKVFRIHPEGIEEVNRSATQDGRAATEAGTALAGNNDLDLPVDTRNLMTGGRVDPRLLIVLPQVAALGRLGVSDFPAIPGEESAAQPRRSVLISSVAGRPLTGSAADATAVTALLNNQPGPYAPRSVSMTDQGLLVTYAIDAPTGLLGTAAADAQ